MDRRMVSPEFDLRVFARKTQRLPVMAVMDTLLMELHYTRPSVEAKDLFAEQYSSDLESILRLFVGTALPEEPRPGFVEDSWPLLDHLSNYLTVLTPEYMDSLRSTVDELLASGDFLGLVFDRTDVETKNIWTALRILNRLTEEPWLSRFRGRSYDFRGREPAVVVGRHRRRDAQIQRARAIRIADRRLAKRSIHRGASVSAAGPPQGSRHSREGGNPATFERTPLGRARRRVRPRGDDGYPVTIVV